MLNIVIPMSGRGSRFSNAGYVDPKPLISIKGQRMIELVIDNLTPQQEHRFIFICLAEHVQTYQVDQILKAKSPNCEVITITEVTEGAACTVLKARNFISSVDPLMIANSDQWVDMSINDYLHHALLHDGAIMTMPSSDPKWSFVRKSPAGFVSEVAEKKVISNEATVGIYNFSSGLDFVKAADEMIAKDLRVNGEFYVAPVFNLLIKQGLRIATYDIGDNMWGLGTPSDLQHFLDVKVK